MSIYPFNRYFRLKIIALCLDSVWMSRVGSSLIIPDYFEADDEKAVITAILDYYEAYRLSPTDPDDVLVMCDGEHENTIYTVFDEAHDGEMHLVKDVVIQWAKEQAAKIAILDSVDDVNRGNLAAVLERIEAAVMVGEDLTSPGIDVIRDIDEWLYYQWTDKVKTGWPHIDNMLEGGLGPGELGVILAPSNRGKSMALVNIAYGAAGIGSAKNVVIFTHEMSEKIYAKRIAARMMFQFPRKGDDLVTYENNMMSLARKLMPGSIRIIGGTRMTTYQMEASLERLKAEGFDFHLIICDYPDLVLPPNRRDQKRHEISEVYEWYRSLGAMYQVPAWGASQTNRGAYRKEVISLEDIAEDIGKVNISDIVMAICQTEEEAEAERCRLFAAKVRDGESGGMFDAKYYRREQAIITTGITKKREAETDA